MSWLKLLIKMYHSFHSFNRILPNKSGGKKGKENEALGVREKTLTLFFYLRTFQIRECHPKS